MGSDGQGVGLRNRTRRCTPAPPAMPVSGRLHSGRSMHPNQFSGNGMSGQTSWLSFAANGDWLKLGAMAILTTSSNRSNSTSLIAHSKCAGTMIVRIAISPKITDAPLPVLITSFSSLQEDEKPELSRPSHGDAPKSMRGRGRFPGARPVIALTPSCFDEAATCTASLRFQLTLTFGPARSTYPLLAAGPF